VAVDRHPTGWRAAALVVGLTALAVILAACSGGASKAATSTTTTAPATTTTSAPLAAGRQLSFYVPSVGDCYDKRTVGAAPQTSIIFLLLPCATPHQNEVFATFDYPDPNYPSAAVLEQFAKQHCIGGFATYVGRPYETSVYDIGYELPQQATWGNGIRHVIGCLVEGHDGHRLSGSARGAAR
jgi:hypothetical protein